MNLQDSVELFVQFKMAEMIKERTIRSYTDHIQALINYLPKSVDVVRASDIAGFLAKERKRGLSPATIADRYRALNIFFNWRANCEEIGRPVSPMAEMKPPKVPTIEPHRAALADVLRLIRAIPDNNWIDARDKAIVQLMHDTGLRLSETASLLVKDVDLEERIIFVRYGKGDKSRRVPFSKKTVKLVTAYLSCRPKSASHAKHLWFSAKNEDGVVRGILSKYGITQILKRRCVRHRIPHINPHSIRHLFGMKALNDGIRIEVVSVMMGHSSIDFTRKVYAPMLTQTTQKEYDLNWK